jgi:heterodisulfide reductase subunit C
VLHFFKKGERKCGAGYELFLKSYADDGLFAIDSKTRSQMPSFSQCLSCRLCDVVCPQLVANPVLLPPSYIVTAFSRSLPDYALFQKSTFDCGTCRECEKICPEHVPIRKILDFMANAPR